MERRWLPLNIQGQVKPFKSSQSTYEYKYEIKKSIFLAESKMVLTVEEAEDFVQSIRDKHLKATHHVYAYSIIHGGLKQKADDDGEPSGTSAMPILKAIELNGLQNIVIVVTRYFGGIKLGAGGLSRAYMAATTGVIEEFGIREFKEYQDLDIYMDYESYDIFLNFVKNAKIDLIDSEFLENVKATISIKLEDVEKIEGEILNLTAGKALIEKKGIKLK